MDTLTQCLVACESAPGCSAVTYLPAMRNCFLKGCPSRYTVSCPVRAPTCRGRLRLWLSPQLWLSPPSPVSHRSSALSKGHCITACKKVVLHVYVCTCKKAGQTLLPHAQAGAGGRAGCSLTSRWHRCAPVPLMTQSADCLRWHPRRGRRRRQLRWRLPTPPLSPQRPGRQRCSARLRAGCSRPARARRARLPARRPCRPT